MAEKKRRIGCAPEIMVTLGAILLIPCLGLITSTVDNTDSSRAALALDTTPAPQVAHPPDEPSIIIPDTEPLASVESGYITYLTLEDGRVVCGYTNSREFFPKYYNNQWPDNLTPSQIEDDLAGLGAGPPYYFIAGLGDNPSEVIKSDTLSIEESEFMANLRRLCVPAFLGRDPTPPPPMP